MKKIWVLAVVWILVLFVSCVVAGDVIIDETVRLPKNSYHSYFLVLEEGDTITAEIQQTESGVFGTPTVDAYIFLNCEYDDFLRFCVEQGERDVGYTQPARYEATDVVRTRFTWTAYRTETYHLVLDNTFCRTGGCGITVDIRVEKETPKPTPTPRQRAIEPIEYERSSPEEPGFLAMSAIAGILIALYLIRRNK